jgi:integral membrane protein (TIGR00529 family)
VPALLKFLLIVVLTMFLLRRKIPLGLVMLLNSILLSLLCLMNPLVVLRISMGAAVGRATILLLAVLFLVTLLERILSESGQLERMIRALEQVIPSRRLRLILMPAFLGFLPSPGGAMFSAPFVEKAGRPLDLPADQKAFLNYWFRHVWEFVLPLYPGVVMAISIAGITYSDFFSITWLYSLASIAAGILFGLIPLRLRKEERPQGFPPPGSFGAIMIVTFPVLALLVMVLFFKWDLSASLALIVLFQFIISRLSWKSLPRLLKKSFSWQIAALVIGVYVFKDLLSASGLADGMAAFLSSLGIHRLLLLLILPMAIGFLTGINQAFVGICFPILLGLLNLPSDLDLLGFAYASGVLGIYLSPMHLCLALSAEYFKTDIPAVLRHLLLPVLFMLLVAMLRVVF